MSFDPISAGLAVLSIAGNVSAGNSAKRAALQQQQAANWEAAQMRVNAGQALAESQLAAQEERRQGELVQSRARALLAAQGGSLTDPSAVALLSRNAGETAYRSAVALYKGQEESRQMLTNAMATEASGIARAQEGRNAQKAYTMQGLASAASLFTKFGGDGPPVGTQLPAEVRTATPRVIG